MVEKHKKKAKTSALTWIHLYSHCAAFRSTKRESEKVEVHEHQPFRKKSPKIQKLPKKRKLTLYKLHKIPFITITIQSFHFIFSHHLKKLFMNPMKKIVSANEL